MILGIVVGLVSLYFHQQDVDQRECITRNFSTLSTSLTERAEAAAAEARTTRAESRANRKFYRDAFASKNRRDVFEAYGDYRARLEVVDQRRERIKADREAHPIPDFPAGSCN